MPRTTSASPLHGDHRRQAGNRTRAGARLLQPRLCTHREARARPRYGDLEEAIKIDPTYACSFSNRGRVWAFKNDLNRAIEDYNTAIKLDPDFATAYNNRGDAFLRRSEIDRAIADFNQAIKLDPQHAKAYGNRGYAFQMKRDYLRAIDDYSMQIKITPNDLLAYINRGNVWRSMQKNDDAMADYAEVIRIAPKDARGWRNRGLIKLLKNDFRAASPITIRPSSSIPRTPTPGTTAASPSATAATTLAPSPILRKRWRSTRTSNPPATACASWA